MKATGGQVRAWRGTGYPCKLIAAAMAEWADGKERGIVLPDDGFFGIAASPSTCKRAGTFLVTQGVSKPMMARTAQQRSYVSAFGHGDEGRKHRGIR